ncbi:chlorophyll(ide) b reductase NOL, chloroplastic isoform X3 [Abrus precatorius]|uniref:Chlorophyll(Ide) b reductase NOL, chloroplastic isoform X3 n=1 Tax=Abrus precatorius TaxID=3816 RepID=A0A8B8LF74_ABRPR|nr:chlorophyll(ide) b reductase NOL, chloroplastic isoform X3 [Abrus precatorius]
MATTVSFFPSPTLLSHYQLSLSSVPKFKPYTVASRQLLCISHNTISVSAFRNQTTSPTFLAMSSPNTEPMLPPYNVLITGSSKGIGYALAKEFLKAGDNVMICSRSYERVETSVQSLRVEFGEQHVWGTKCDVRNAEDVKNLVSFAQEKLKYIDIWINNAGSNAYSYKPLAEASDEDLIEVVTTNTLGLMICCREAELQMQDVKNVVVHNLSPGMVTTDLLMSGGNTKQAKFFINVLAEPAEVVAEYLVPNIRSIPANGSMKPTYIRFLTGLKAYSQIFSRLAFGARRNRYILED